MEYVNTFDKQITQILNEYVRKPTIIRGVVHLLLILYAARLAPTLPREVMLLFENQYFKLFVFSLVLWTAQFSPSTSILIALAFMVTVNYSMNKSLWEFLENVEEAPKEPVTTEQAVEAVKTLAEAATSSDAISPELVKPVAEIAASAVTTQDGMNAVKDLAEQAMVPEAGDVQKVTDAAQTAVDSISPQPQVQPMETPGPVTTAAPVPTTAPVMEVAKAVVSEPAECYPVRRYDMSKVEPSSGQSFEQEFVK